MNEKLLKGHTVVHDSVAEMKKLFTEAFVDLAKASLEAGGAPPSNETLVDYILVLRKTRELLKAIATSLQKSEDNFIDQIYARAHQSLTEEGGLFNPTVRTEYVTATIGLDAQIPIPSFRRNQEAFFELARFYGIPDLLIKHGAVDFDWPGMTAVIKEQLENGQPLPTGFDSKAYLKKSITIRQKKEILCPVN